MRPYHPALVILHWLLAILVPFLLLFGADLTLRVHLALGIAIGGLFLIRLGIRFTTGASGVHEAKRPIDRLAIPAHRLIYLLVFGVVATGLGIVLQGNLIDVMLNHGRLPENFSALPSLQAHQVLTSVLLIVLSIHILAALFHQFVLKDAVFGKLGFAKSRED
ncbi:cytochrome b/b6 domain-containing protein [Aestuariirhabdus sp. Z084]|uniref:cytochrome b n=1 Tax=Aestuariirhabdus haliotis TaxID=2918751 RepID=UPI00201B3D16|nr:cytochrome b/b6 domain-containing protein [Aestuariirhabdus haliotis]MCL6417702.1 cytochrome b/b6 domain-containing protein [Aestuariirhabdus haliotis]MCL6421641.1 cytochrome b/b6 domain-containing protein [Aestuariirhabdus haliotis]